MASIESDIESELGFRIENVTIQLLRKYEIYDNVEGVVVTNIDRRSEAFTAGLRPGDVITRVGRRNVNSIKNFYELLDAESRGNTVLLLVKRKDVSRFLTLEM